MDLGTGVFCCLTFWGLNFISIWLHNIFNGGIVVQQGPQSANNEASSFTNTMIWMNQDD